MLKFMKKKYKWIQLFTWSYQNTKKNILYLQLDSNIKKCMNDVKQCKCKQDIDCVFEKFQRSSVRIINKMKKFDFEWTIK